MFGGEARGRKEGVFQCPLLPMLQWTVDGDFTLLVQFTGWEHSTMGRFSRTALPGPLARVPESLPSDPQCPPSRILS